MHLLSTTHSLVAPEAFTHSGDCSKSKDIWAAGLALSQLLTGYALLPEHTAVRFMQVGTAENCVTVCEENADFAINSVAEIYGEDSPAVDLLKKMLTLDPETRLDAQQVMEHKFMQQFRETELMRKEQSRDSPSSDTE